MSTEEDVPDQVGVRFFTHNELPQESETGEDPGTEENQVTITRASCPLCRADVDTVPESEIYWPDGRDRAPNWHLVAHYWAEEHSVEAPSVAVARRHARHYTVDWSQGLLDAIPSIKEQVERRKERLGRGWRVGLMMGGLTELQREALILARDGGTTAAEVAAETGYTRRGALKALRSLEGTYSVISEEGSPVVFTEPDDGTWAICEDEDLPPRPESDSVEPDDEADANGSLHEKPFEGPWASPGPMDEDGLL